MRGWVRIEILFEEVTEVFESVVVIPMLLSYYTCDWVASGCFVRVMTELSMPDRSLRGDEPLKRDGKIESSAKFSKGEISMLTML